MDKPPSFRWLWTGVGALGAASAMGLTAMVTAEVRAPKAVSFTFMGLAPLFALVSFSLICIGAAKGRAENKQLVASAFAKMRASGVQGRTDFRQDI